MKNFVRGIFTGGLLGIVLSAIYFGAESTTRAKRPEENSKVLGFLRREKISKIKNILDE